MRKVKLNDIRIDGGTQGRLLIDQEMVYHYLECMKDGAIFPPLETVFDGATYWLVDGFHRYHAYKLLGTKQIEVNYKPGTQLEAQVISFGANGKHGKPRSKEDKRFIVEQSLAHELTKGMSDYELAKICDVSKSFIAAVRSPEKKKKQAEAKQKHIVKKAKEINDTSSLTTNPESGMGPDDDELRANELAMQADQDAMYKLLESDEPLKEAHEEIKRLNHLNSQLEVRLHGLMNERNEAVKMVKKLQTQLDKINKVKK